MNMITVLNGEYYGTPMFTNQMAWPSALSKQLQWRHNGRDGVANHQPHDCLLNRLFWRRSKKTSKLRGTGLCDGNSPGTGEFPAQRASNAENVSIWWRHHVIKWLIITSIEYYDKRCAQRPWYRFWQNRVDCCRLKICLVWHQHSIYLSNVLWYVWLCLF